MAGDGRQLQRIDSLLRQEPIDRLRDVLVKSEGELAAKRASAISLIGDAHPEVLRCATAILRIHSSCQGLVTSTHELKPLQAGLQSLLLEAGPTQRKLWTSDEGQGHTQRESAALSHWLKICPYLWSVSSAQNGGPSADDVIDETSPNQMKKKRKIQRLSIRSYGDLPRSVLEMLSHSQPLQGLCLLSGWGPLVRQQLLELQLDPATSPEDKSHISSVLERQRSYFSCHDLLIRAKASARQSLSHRFPSPWLTCSSLPTLPPRCRCASCTPLIRAFSYPGTSAALEIVTAMMILDPRASLSDEVLSLRSELMEKLVEQHTDALNGEPSCQSCELVDACFGELATSHRSRIERSIRIGYQLSAAIRVFEVTEEMLLVLDTCRTSSIQKAALKLFTPFCRSNSEDLCSCYFCASGKETVPIHLWGDCSSAPAVSVDISEISNESSASETHNNVQRLSSMEFGERWSSRLYHVAEEVSKVILSGSEALSEIDGMWRLVYSLTLSDRLYWTAQRPFGGGSNEIRGASHYRSIKSLLNDPQAFVSSQDQEQGFFAALEVPHLKGGRVEDPLYHVAQIFDSTFESHIKQQTKDTVRRHLMEALKSSNSALESLTAMDTQIASLLITSECIISSACSWCRILRNNPPVCSDFKFDFTVENWLLSPLSQQLLRRASPLSKSSLIRACIEDALVAVTEEWFHSALHSDPQGWGVNGWIFTLIAEALDVGECCVPCAASPSQNAYNFSFDSSGPHFLPFTSWLFKVTTDLSKSDVAPFISTLRKVGDACLYRWTLKSAEASAHRLLSAIKDDIALTLHEIDDRTATSDLPQNKTRWKRMSAPSGDDGTWSVPSEPLPALGSLLFEVGFRFASLRENLKINGQSGSLSVAVVSRVRRSIKNALSDLICSIYSFNIQPRLPLSSAVQMLFDLQFSEVLLCETRKRCDLTACDNIVPTYLKHIWISQPGPNMSQLQSRIRDECLGEMVDRLLYSSRNLLPAVLQSLETQLLLVAPFVKTEESSGPLIDLKTEWNSKLLVGIDYEAKPPVAPLAPRLTLLPVAAQKVTIPLSEIRPKAAQKLNGSTSELNVGRVDYALSAAAALREMKDVLDSTGAANIAADLGSSAYRNVSNLSSFLRGHVEGFSSKVSEAMKTRGGP